ncbi:MAG: hypothetical protein MEQ84_03415 [Mesorhizobium sp.]|nr:hypothetical protein [Mesorhizobium sp.]
MNSSSVDIEQPPGHDAADRPVFDNEDVADVIDFPQRSTIPPARVTAPQAIAVALAEGAEPPWAAALALVESAALQMQRSERAFNSKANDVIAMTFRLVGEKTALEKAVEEADKRYKALQREHQSTLALLRETELLCRSLKKREEQLETASPEVDPEMHGASSLISRIRHFLRQAARD